MQNALVTSGLTPGSYRRKLIAKGEADNGHKGPLNPKKSDPSGAGESNEGSTGFIPAGMDGNAEVIGAYAWAHEMSSGKDTPVWSLGNRRCPGSV